MSHYIYLVILLFICFLSIVCTIKLNEAHYKSYDSNVSNHGTIQDDNHIANRIFELFKQEVNFYGFIVKKYSDVLFVPIQEIRQNLRDKIEHLKY